MNHPGMMVNIRLMCVHTKSVCRQKKTRNIIKPHISSGELLKCNSLKFVIVFFPVFIIIILKNVIAIDVPIYKPCIVRSIYGRHIHTVYPNGKKIIEKQKNMTKMPTKRYIWIYMFVVFRKMQLSINVFCSQLRFLYIVIWLNSILKNYRNVHQWKESVLVYNNYMIYSQVVIWLENSCNNNFLISRLYMTEYWKGVWFCRIEIKLPESGMVFRSGIFYIFKTHPFTQSILIISRGIQQSHMEWFYRISKDNSLDITVYSMTEEFY